MGVVGKRLFEPKEFIGEFPIDAKQAEQRREKAVAGCPFVSPLYFGQAK
jgi:hypothetical protein